MVAMRPGRFVALVLLTLLPVLVGADDAYEIGAGDIVTLTILGQPAMSGDFTVDAEGFLGLPVVGKVKATGLTAAALERKLTTLLADGYLKRPEVSVGVKEFRSQRVFVTGEVARPGPYNLKSDRSLRIVLGDVGGLRPDAGHEILVIRPAEGATEQAVSLPEGDLELTDQFPGAEVYRLAARELMSGRPERDFLLRANDTVYVPQAAQVYVTGHVSRPGPYRFQEGTTVLQALTLAGGVTERGSDKRVRIVRVVDGKKTEVRAKLTDPVLPGDTLVVPERFF